MREVNLEALSVVSYAVAGLLPVNPIIHCRDGIGGDGMLDQSAAAGAEVVEEHVQEGAGGEAGERLPEVGQPDVGCGEIIGGEIGEAAGEAMRRGVEEAVSAGLRGPRETAAGAVGGLPQREAADKDYQMDLRLLDGWGTRLRDDGEGVSESGL
ncbi:hypothetical protein BDZ91DRAFT_802544 [Kalaharituber pfeilii]|nr:hypothetical protein BDZ91DRAFT_802544 [Kalaharituber pfeilii]